MSRVIPIEVRREAHRRVVAVLRCLDVLLPDAPPRRRKKVANRILSMCDGRDRRVRITQSAALEMVHRNVQCISRDCPMLIFAEPLSKESNLFFESED